MSEVYESKNRLAVSMQGGKFDYMKIERAVWKALLKSDVRSLPVDVSQVATAHGVRVLRDSQAKLLVPGESGFTVCGDGNTYIIYNDKESYTRSTFTIAHELGHILLGHLENGEMIEGGECEANMFAIRLLTPACVLHELRCQSAADIARRCDVSLQAATFRAELLGKMEKSNRWYRESLEIQLYAQFEKYIKQNRRLISPPCPSERVSAEIGKTIR